ncbi:apoptotic process [Pristimantis euphronides]
MTGLSAREKEGCRRLLAQLDIEELFSVAETVTNRLIHVFSRDEAFDAIIIYSKSAEELLKRRKVHRGAIFKYLASENVTVLPSTEKNQLIQCALDHWRGPSAQHTTLPRQTVSRISVDEEPPEPLDCQLLGEQFCGWFYSLLNSQNPSFGQEKGNWGPQHFWENAALKLAYRATEQAVEEHDGAQMASLRLLALTRDERLLFNPSMDSRGLKCVRSPHGLVVVAVAGTIHRDNVYLGIFEEIFGLVRCPVGKNWKIKNVDLKILGQNTLSHEESQRPPAVTLHSGELEVYYG